MPKDKTRSTGRGKLARRGSKPIVDGSRDSAGIISEENSPVGQEVPQSEFHALNSADEYDPFRAVLTLLERHLNLKLDRLPVPLHLTFLQKNPERASGSKKVYL
jgi:hypothetical protein